MRWFLLVVALLGISGCMPFMASAPAGARGHVAYIHEGDLWVRELPDGAPRRLTDGGEYLAPVWSPSGQWVLVGSKEGFLAVRSDGSETHRLPAGASRAVWSPVEDVLAYLDGEGRPSVVKADGTGSRVVAEERNAGGPTWSPDGLWLAYTRGAPDRTYIGIWRVPVAGGQPQEVYGKRGTEPQCLIMGPWVPGESILFWDMFMCSASLTADGLPLMAVSPASGMPPRKLVDAMLVHPDFLSVAPAGRLAAAEGSDRQTWTNKRVVVVNSKARPISPEDMAAISPAWAPDASRIAFAAMPDIGPVGGGEPARQGMMQRRIWSVAPDGTNLRRLTDDARYRDEAPHWTQDGGHILFCRLDRQTKASLWLVNAAGGTPQKVADVDPPESWFGYYGYVNCSAFFDYWGETPVRQTATVRVEKTAARTRTEQEVERTVRQAVAALRADQEEDAPKRVMGRPCLGAVPREPVDSESQP